MRLVLLGAHGMLGRELARSLAPLGEVIALGRAECDITDAAILTATINDARPTIIVNATAYTAVDRAESEADAAFAVNAEAPGQLAALAREHDAFFVHYSTDYVFSGTKGMPYSEDDAPAPLSVYGQSKLAGEEAIRHGSCRHLILRTSGLFAAHGENFLTAILRQAQTQDTLNVVGDQLTTPTFARHLAIATAWLLAYPEPPHGLYHLAAGGTSWHGFAEAICAEALRLGLLAGKPQIRRITSAEFSRPAMRPADARLDCARIEKACGIQLPHWRWGLDECLTELSFTS